MLSFHSVEYAQDVVLSAEFSLIFFSFSEIRYFAIMSLLETVGEACDIPEARDMAE